MTTLNNAEGLFCWADLATTNTDAAQKFYSELLGWTWEKMTGADGRDYFTAKQGDQAVGGLMQTPCDKGTCFWGTYFYTNDLDSKIKKVESLGAQTMFAKTEIPNYGAFSVHADPAGVPFYLWQCTGKAPTEPYAQRTHGHFCWTEHMSSKMDQAGKFYCEAFGWTPENMENSPYPYTIFKMDDYQNVGMMSWQKEWGEECPCWQNYISVDSVTKTTAKAVKLGAKVKISCEEIPNIGFFTTLQDPQGAFISFISKDK